MAARPVHQDASACVASELVVEEFAAECAALRERLTFELGLKESYRVLSQQAIGRIHELNRQIDRLREIHEALVEENRRLRALILRAEAAA